MKLYKTQIQDYREVTNLKVKKALIKIKSINDLQYELRSISEVADREDFPLEDIGTYSGVDFLATLEDTNKMLCDYSKTLEKAIENAKIKF